MGNTHGKPLPPSLIDIGHAGSTDIFVFLHLSFPGIDV